MNINDLFKVVKWPEIQTLMELEGFEDNSILINSEKLLREYGFSSYLVRYTWLDQNS
jgi:hypothetical protein